MLCCVDYYAGPGKPLCDWDDREACESLVVELVRAGLAVLAVFDGATRSGRSKTLSSCWRCSPGKMSKRAMTACSGSPEGLPVTSDLHR